MSCSQSRGKKRSAAEAKSEEGSIKGKLYEKLSLALLAETGNEHSKQENSEFRDFAIGREVKIDEESNIDDVVFRYKGQDNKNYHIFVQIKHKQDVYQINSEILSTEAYEAKATGGSDGGMRRDFNLQKYFFSYLKVKEELKVTKSKEFINGEIKYIAIFTNIDLNTDELNDKGFNLKEPPSDIMNLFTLKTLRTPKEENISKISSSMRKAKSFYQLSDVSDGLREILRKSSDLQRLARKIAQYVVWKSLRDKHIIGIDEAPIKYYHVALEREVIETYCDAQFRNDFIDNDEAGSKKELRDAIFEAVRDLDKTKKGMSEDELKTILREVKWKVASNFGKNKKSKRDLPCKWMTTNKSELHEIARELAQYVVLEKHRSENILGKATTPINDYGVAFKREIITTSGEACDAQFRIEFIDNDKTGSKKELRDATFEAVRELDKSKSGMSEDELKTFLRGVKWKVAPNFGKNKKSKRDLPYEWMATNKSELHEIARELAQYIVLESHRNENILGKIPSPINNYQVAFKREIIKISDQVCDAEFRIEFINSDKTESKKELRDAIFEAVRELDKSKKDSSNDELKTLLKEVKLKVTPNFGATKQNSKINLPCKKTIKEEDITNFLNCLVFIVNQPSLEELENHFNISTQDVVLEGVSLSQLHKKIQNTGPVFRKRIEEIFGIDKKIIYEEKWISGEKIKYFISELEQLIHVTFIVTALTVIYENEVMQYGKFKNYGILMEKLNSFLHSGSKVICVSTLATVLTSIRILQYLNTKESYRAEDGRISISLDFFKSKKNRDCVVKAFESESNNLLIIECRHTVNDQDLEELYFKLSHIIRGDDRKKIILIRKHYECAMLDKMFRMEFQHKGLYVQENDSISLKDFESKEDPLRKDAFVFQEQEEKLSLAQLTGINSWNSYVDCASEEEFQKKQDIIDITTLDKILSNEEIKIGSNPPGTSSLEGAYASLFEEINTESFADRISSQGFAYDTNDIYIISGIVGSNQNEKIDKLIQYLGLVNERNKIENQLGEVGSDSKIQIVDDLFKNDHFKQLCHNYPEKQIFWISVKNGESGVKFILESFYNPKFYFKRKFKNIIINKHVKGELTNKRLSEIFIIYCANDQKVFIDFWLFANELEKETIEYNCEKGRIKLFTVEADAKATFQEIGEQDQNQVIHLLKFEEKQFIWCNSHGSVRSLRKHIDNTKISLAEEDNLFQEIKDRKVVIFADDPGMGKTTTLTKLCESKYESVCVIKSHWIFRINLRDHIQAIRDIELKNDSIDNTVNVVEFLSKIDSKLNHSMAKNLLGFALDQSKNFSKPLLLAFDGFDEILDEDDRNKIISLLKFLKNKTAAKLWITTRLHYKAILENELQTFAIEFVPMNDEDKVKFVKKYLSDRLCLILSEEMFSDLFLESNDMQENKRIKIYSEAFLSKMESVFKGNLFKFIGTPLQLNLMLEGSIRNFKNWIENDEDQNVNFNYLGNDIWDVYKKFIDRKYDIYFKKLDIKERLRQKQDKRTLNRYNKDFAEFLILKSRPKDESLTEFKDIILLAGVIKSQGSNMEFIHNTFRDYFAAKVIIRWIKNVLNEPLDPNKQDCLLKEILNKPDYQLIRTFINCKLEKIAETEVLGEIMKQFRITTEKLLREKEYPLIDVARTALYVAVAEGNANIARLLLNSLKGHNDVLKNVLFIRVLYDTPLCHFATERMSILHTACRRNDYEIVRILLDAAAEISEDTLQEFLDLVTISKENALDIAVQDSNVQIAKELLNREKNKLHLIMNEKKEESSFILACQHGNENIVKFLLQEFEHDENSVKQLLLDNDGYGNTLYWAIWNGSENIVEYLLFVAISMNDNKETLKKLLLPEEGTPPFNAAVNFSCDCQNYRAFVKILLDVAKNINDDNHTLKQMLLNEKNFALCDAAREGCCDIIKLLLETAATLGSGMLETLIFAVDKSGNNAVQIMFKRGFENKFAESFKILEEDKYKVIQRKVTEMLENSRLTNNINSEKNELIDSVICNDRSRTKRILDFAKNAQFNPNEKLKILLLSVDNEVLRRNTLHIACENGYSDLIKELISYAISIYDEATTLKELVTSRNDENKTPFEVLKNGYTSKIKQIVENLIHEATSNNKIYAVNILQEINDKYSEVLSDSQDASARNMPVLSHDIIASDTDLSRDISNPYTTSEPYVTDSSHDIQTIEYEINRILLDSGAEISEDTLQEFLDLMTDLSYDISDSDTDSS